MAETAKVTEFLREALRDDCEDASPSRSSSELTLQGISPPLSTPASVAPSNTTSAVESRFSGLPPRYLAFAVVAVERQNWLRTELESLAQRHGLMLGAAMEAINEWSFDTLSDALFLDSDEEIYIQQQLMP